MYSPQSLDICSSKELLQLHSTNGNTQNITQYFDPVIPFTVNLCNEY